jgi:hypothetical protein
MSPTQAPMSRVLVVALCLLGGASHACSELRTGELERTTLDNAEPVDGGTTPPLETDAAADAASSQDDASTPTSVRVSYNDMQQTLQGKRFPGPVTAQGSTGACTPKKFYWRDPDGSVHAWVGSTQTRIDFAWKASGYRPSIFPSDDLFAVDTPPTFATIDVHDTSAVGTAGAPFISLPYAHHHVSASGAVLRLDQTIDNVSLGGTKVRAWHRATQTLEDITTVLPTTEPPSSFKNDTLVVPGAYPPPFPLYIVDIKGKTTKSVTFEGGIALGDTEQTEDGLVISYVRSGAAGATLRVYKNNSDDLSSRFELGDELASRPNYFDDAAPLEHKFVARVTSHGRRIFYSSAYGIWAYDFASSAFAPVQLVAGQKTGVPDILCVLKDEGLLMYRMTSDPVGQVWAVPLTAIFP